MEGGGGPEEIVTDGLDDEGEHLVAPIEEDGESNVADLFLDVIGGREERVAEVESRDRNQRQRGDDDG